MMMMKKKIKKILKKIINNHVEYIKFLQFHKTQLNG
jgi:hypothetical protein